MEAFLDWVPRPSYFVDISRGPNVVIYQERLMDRQICRWSYWMGIASSVIAIVWRLGNALSFLPNSLIRHEMDISYLSLLHLGFLFFIITKATACYSWSNSQT